MGKSLFILNHPVHHSIQKYHKRVTRKSGLTPKEKLHNIDKYTRKLEDHV